MMVYTLRQEQIIGREIKEVFSFFERPENLCKITPPKMKFDILTPQPLEMRTGAVFDYVVNIMGVNQHWRTLIERYNPPHSFIDIQLNGPYRLWHHTHEFEEHAEGTLIRDTIRYVLPFGFIGRIVHPLIVRPQLERIFSFRRKAIDIIFPAETMIQNSANDSISPLHG
ncbi:MAG: SRPBCC family protein [Candidatus Zixiibacteriota bacterium]